MDIFKSFLIGLGTIILGIWAIIGIRVLITASYISAYSDEGVFVWQWFTWFWILPELAFGAGVIFMSSWMLGDQIRGKINDY